jgi:phosphatidate phosphatase APP1
MSSLLEVMTRRPRPLTNLAEEDRVVLFPSLGSLAEGGRHWIVNLHGDVSAAAKATLGQRLLLKMLQRAMRASDDAMAGELFQQRIARFIARDRPGRRIAVRIGDAVVPLPKKTRRNGHFQATVRVPREEHSLAEGPAPSPLPLVVHGPAQTAVAGRVFLLAPRGLSVITDIDDTLKHSYVACKRTLLTNTFLRPFETIPGMAELFRDWSAQGAAIHYVSSSPWQLYEHLAEHLAQEGFPDGSFHLRAFRLRDHLLRRVLLLRRTGKLAVIRNLLRMYPQRRFLLVGDSGERDPEIYGALARRYPEQVAGICVRQLDARGSSRARFAKAFRRIDSSLVRLYRDAEQLAGLRLAQP